MVYWSELSRLGGVGGGGYTWHQGERTHIGESRATKIRAGFATSFNVSTIILLRAHCARGRSQPSLNPTPGWPMTVLTLIASVVFPQTARRRLFPHFPRAVHPAVHFPCPLVIPLTTVFSHFPPHPPLSSLEWILGNRTRLSVVVRPPSVWRRVAVF